MQRTFSLTMLNLVAASTLTLFGWGSLLLLQHPEAGMTWSLSDGQVYNVDPEGPAAKLVQLGDIVKSIDNIPVAQARFLAGRQIGEVARFQIESNGSVQLIPIRLVRAAPEFLVLRFIPILVGLAFWGVGFLTLSYSSSDKQSVLFFLFSQGNSVTLIAGALSSVAPLWITHLFNLSLWLIGPLSIHFHLHFPQTNQFGKLRPVLMLMYGIALTSSLPDLLGDPVELRATLPMLYTIRLLWLVITLLTAIILLAMHYRRAETAYAREQIRIVTWGGILAFTPQISLVLLPSILSSQPFVPYEYAFLFLALIPAGYAYAIARYRLINLNRYLQRAAIYVVMAIVLALLSLLLYSTIMRALKLTAEQNYVVGSGIALLCVSVAFTIFNFLRKLVEQHFYGGWYDYRSAVRQIGQQFDLSMDVKTIGQVFTRQIREVLLFDMSALLLIGRDGTFYVIEPDSQQNTSLAPPLPDSSSVVVRYLQQLTKPLTAHKLRQELAHMELSEPETRLVAFPEAQWWLPLLGPDNLLAVLVIGAKRGGEVFTEHDLDILDALNRQVSAVLHNALLIEQLRQQADELRQLTRQIMHVREEERKHLSRTLHDHTIQSLISLNYHIAHRQTALTSESGETSLDFQEELQTIVSDLRQVCSDLRPPQLDNLGLASAVRMLVRKMHSQTDSRIELRIEGDEELEILEESAVCIYYALKEALSNVQKHATANRVTVSLHMTMNKAGVIVEDDGQGFKMPTDLGTLVHEKHFGLIGLRERLEQVGGFLYIDSQPGTGTRLEAWVEYTDTQYAEGNDV